MKRYAKLQRRIAAEQEDFLIEVIKAAGFKVCLEPDRPPEGHSVLIEPEHRIHMARQLDPLPHVQRADLHEC